MVGGFFNVLGRQKHRFQTIEVHRPIRAGELRPFSRPIDFLYGPQVGPRADLWRGVGVVPCYDRGDLLGIDG